ncbi:hypothetical protein [Clostridium chauvoei]|uniref:Uncharacterized protein n=3 Tax=Clostridium chauvoei TaxID=46867 RepID=A0A1U6IWN1_9CLOT|nr:hypothetical protein [Clostridium chauvoei]ATD56033.1 hypothetical protein BTM20_12795 [Clostridium chauvoei]ATD58180.1 hypothetical protein BTM21_10695 [Clostridium chauvoei]MBX7281640.1 hypothetical protein [Clostridium chauvoei]MBX7284139.1 hypothetical protein [Clostridium chauvoei]MBX7286667.1 hypothetical protein [Clostridium chauvoei]
MRQNYDSFDYWENLISENKTIRGHMFMDTPPTEKSLYIHTLIYCRNNGLNNVWSYFPNEKALLGYIQYSFLQEAFYKWIYGKDRLILRVPNTPVEKVISDAQSSRKISEEEASLMIKQLDMLKKCWDLPTEKVLPEILKFVREFNRVWYGDHTEFLYIKIFKSAEDLGEFVISSSYMTSTTSDFEKRVTVDIDNWREICKNAVVDRRIGEKFKDILLKSLTEVI